MTNPFASRSERLKWIALATGSALIAGFAARNLVKATWRAFADDDPPMNPASLDTEWEEAAAWTLGTALAAGAARLIARRGAASVWEQVTGTRPPAFNKSIFKAS